MNILIANDDGPGAEGLEVLMVATRAAYPDATIVSISPKQAIGGQGLSVTPKDLEDLPVEKVAAHFYVCDAKPADLIYLALGQPERFLGHGSFDLVLTGINHGENIGMDVFHSGTVGMAMLASTFFRTTSVAFSMQISRSLDGKQNNTRAKQNTDFVVNFLKSNPHAASLCWNVNFPSGNPRGWKVCSVAYHSRFRPYEPEERKHEWCDVVQLAEGFIVISPLNLSVAIQPHKPPRKSADPVYWACGRDGMQLVSLGNSLRRHGGKLEARRVK